MNELMRATITFRFRDGFRLTGTLQLPSNVEAGFEFPFHAEGGVTKRMVVSTVARADHSLVVTADELA
jgi:hypothetical protein